MKIGKKHKLKKAYCPVCLKILDGASGIENNDKPKIGDLTVCIHCASFLTFTTKMSLRLLTPEEIGNLDFIERTHLMECRKAIEQLNKIQKETD